MPLEQVVSGVGLTVTAVMVQRKRPSLITDTSVAHIMHIGRNPNGNIAKQPNAMHNARGMLRNGRRREAQGPARPRLRGGKTCHSNTSDEMGNGPMDAWPKWPMCKPPLISNRNSSQHDLGRVGYRVPRMWAVTHYPPVSAQGCRRDRLRKAPPTRHDNLA